MHEKPAGSWGACKRIEQSAPSFEAVDREWAIHLVSEFELL